LARLNKLVIFRQNKKYMKYFEMFSAEGEQACNEALENIQTLINGDKFISEAEMKKIVKEQIEKIASVHKEVNDTEPEWHFQDYINETLEAKGYAYRVSRWDF
jgi:hypothetical protein